MIADNETIDVLLRGACLAMVGLAWAVLNIRVVGLRSLSKMTSFDFVMTIALGSLVAGAARASDWLQFAQPLTAMSGLFFIQWLAARSRKASDSVAQALQNEPVFLVRNGTFDEQALERTRVAKSDLLAKMRQANVRRLQDVRAAVLETTGDVSILHGGEVDSVLLEDVRSSARPG